jgi:outer membrane receptor for ferrienterochelin and colicins
MKNIFTLIFILLVFNSLYAQTGVLKGKITAENNPVAFATIAIQHTTLGVSADENGIFRLEKIPMGEHQVMVSSIGFKPYQQTVFIQEGEYELNVKIESESAFLDEVVISGTMKEVSKINSTVPVEVYNSTFFQKNPTPALFESLQIVNGVRPQLNCNVCNTGDIHINGMEGPYTMITIDGMPIVSGLSSVYGLNGIPNSMIERIEIVKGPASTLYGSEAVGGLVNVITKNPDKAPLFSVDVFGTSWQEWNIDLGAKFKTKNATALVGVNYFKYANPIDNNGDNFTDVTLQDRISIFNKWAWQRKDNRVASLGVRYLYEDRWGGEMQWERKYRGGSEVYGESIYTHRFELIGTYQLPIAKEKLLLNYSFNTHQQNSVYGNVPYMADQKIAFGQLLWDKKLGQKQDFLLGMALRYTYYDDNTPATRVGDDQNYINRPDKIWMPAVFLQDEISFSPAHKLLLGMRYDYNSVHKHIFIEFWKWISSGQFIY